MPRPSQHIDRKSEKVVLATLVSEMSQYIYRQGTKCTDLMRN